MDNIGQTIKIGNGPMQEYHDNFLFYLSFELRRSQKTIGSYSKDTRYFFDYLGKMGIQDITGVNAQILSEYIQYLAAGKNYKPRSLARAIASLKALFEFLKSEEIIEDNPTVRLKSPRLPKSIPRYLSKTEVEKLITAADDGTDRGKRDAAMLTMLFYTGLRLSEIISLKLKDLAGDFSTVEVRHGKGDKYRILPLHPVLQTVLKYYLAEIRKGEDSPYLFPGVRGEKLAPATVRNIVYRTTKKADINKDVSPHVLRHSIATCLAQTDGVDILDISKFLGHSKLSTTKVYLHADLKHLRQAVERLPVIKRTQEM